MRILLFAAGLLWAGTAVAADAASTGEYLFRAAGCAHCHTDTEHSGAPLAGGRALHTPFGTFYSPNISPDPATGIGRWSEADFRRALRDGVNPSGRHYYPAFPYTSYTHLTDADLSAMWRYLASQKPVSRANQPHELPWYLRARGTLWIWKLLFFEAGPFEPHKDRKSDWNRGAYLVRAVTHCGECHTPRNSLGGFMRAQALAGNPQGVEDTEIPNITPHPRSGIGGWSVSDIAYYLETGATPDGDYAGDLMADVIDHSTSQLTREDRRAIAAYLKSLPPVETPARASSKPKPRQKDPWERVMSANSNPGAFVRRRPFRRDQARHGNIPATFA